MQETCRLDLHCIYEAGKVKPAYVVFAVRKGSNIRHFRQKSHHPAGFHDL